MKNNETIEQYVARRAGEVLNCSHVQIVKRLEGGMSNYTYVVEAEGRKFTYRVPGKHAELFVNRTDEFSHIQAVESLCLNNRTVYFDVESGEKAAEYVEGVILSQTDVSSYDAVSAAALKKLHRSAVALKPYGAFERLENYEQLCRGFHHVFPQNYVKCRSQLDAMRKQYLDIPLVPCHCDYQPTNLVMGAEQLYVLDWEFAGLNDPFYDVACYGNVSMSAAESLLAAYLGHRPQPDELRRLYFHRTYQCLQWYNVAVYKHEIGLSRELNMDFSQVALMFLGFAVDLLEKVSALEVQA